MGNLDSLDTGNLLETLCEDTEHRSSEVLRFSMGQEFLHGETGRSFDSHGIADALERLQNLFVIDSGSVQCC